MAALEREDFMAQAQGGLEASTNALFSVPSDTAALQACVAALGTLACDTREEKPGCMTLMGLPADAQLVMAGGLCEGPHAVCAAGTTCAGDAMASYGPHCGSCVAALPNGQPCQVSWACTSGFCDGSQRCAVAPSRTLAFPGEACGTVDRPRCAVGVATDFCPSGNPANVCAVRGDLGAACGTPGAECLRPLTCVDGLCAAARSDGSPCASSAECSGACGGGGVCVPLFPAPSVDQACVEGVCAAGLVARWDAPGECTCEALAARNSACHRVARRDGPPVDGCAAGDVCFRAHQAETGTCRPPVSRGVGCNHDEECNSGNCAASPGADEPTCAALECSRVTNCSSFTNRSVFTATDVSVGVALPFSLCPTQSSSMQFFRLAGTHAQGERFSIQVMGAANPFIIDVFAELAWKSGANLSYHPNTVTGVPEDGRVYVVVHSPTYSDIGADLLIRPVTDTCALNPTNTLDSPAPVAQLGEVTQGAFCSRATAETYHWSIPGTFAAEDLMLLDVQYRFSAPDGPALRVALQEDPAAAARTRGRHQVTQTRLTGPSSALTVLASGNPSVRADETFSFTVRRDTDNVFHCAQPSNLTPATAIPLVLGVPVTARTCAVDRNRTLYFKAPVLAALTQYQVLTTYDGPNQGAVQTLELSTTGQAGPRAYCTPGACDLPEPNNPDGVFVVVDLFGAPSVGPSDTTDITITLRTTP